MKTLVRGLCYESVPLQKSYRAYKVTVCKPKKQNLNHKFARNNTSGSLCSLTAKPAVFNNVVQ